MHIYQKYKNTNNTKTLTTTRDLLLKNFTSLHQKHTKQQTNLLINHNKYM